MNINFLKYIRPLTFFMPRPNMIFLMNIHIYNMFYICTLYFVLEINVFVYKFMTSTPNRCCLFFISICITFAILKYA